MATAFDELVIGEMTARNRIVRAACAESLCTRAGAPTKRLTDLYARLAAGGAGTLVTGYAYVRADGKPSDRALGLHDDANVPGMRALVAAAHEGGARIVAQLVYGGSKSSLAPDDARRIPDAPPGGPNADVLGPASVAHPKTGLVPRTATESELADVARAFAEAARRAQRAGFDGVEVHAAHGYLLSQFLDGRFNTRDDAYGATLEGRARLACECVAAVREAVGDAFAVLAKINSCDVRDDPRGARGGLSQQDSVETARLLVAAGASAVEASGDWHAYSAADAAEGAFFEEFGARLASTLDVPVIVTGGWRDIEGIERALGQAGIAAAGLCRPLICEPDLPLRWQQGDRAPSRCTSCNYCARRRGIPCIVAKEGHPAR